MTFVGFFKLLQMEMANRRGNKILILTGSKLLNNKMFFVASWRRFLWSSLFGYTTCNSSGGKRNPIILSKRLKRVQQRC